jgi:hypothetical protein
MKDSNEPNPSESRWISFRAFLAYAPIAMLNGPGILMVGSWELCGVFLAILLFEKTDMIWSAWIIGLPVGFLAAAFVTWLVLLGLARLAEAKAKRKD